MRNYSAGLYRKFKTRTMNTLNGDDFYEYFMKVVESGPRFYGQKNEILIKKIDEKWVNAIDKCIWPLESIIKKPRTFIERQENVIPVELARKVGSEAVKHLATHTQYISHVKDGNVIPNKILNVFNEDSLDIYENRFIITLLTRVSQFLDRRYEALFGTTGDEFSSVLKVDSTFNDNDEKVEYSLVLKIHQGQSYLDNQNNDPQIFEKIEHIRTMIASYKKSEFYLNLQSCTQVKSPIQKTNLMTKHPDFKKCYELWQFLDKYTDVGYSIEKRQFDADFEEEYLDELNTTVLYNYLIMKNSLASEHNKAIDIHNFKKKRVIKPKFIRQMIEEFVDDYDVPEVELRKIFNDEISKAYKDKGTSEDEIKAALEKALGIETQKREKEEQEDEIKAALARALGLEDEKKEKEELQDNIMSALERALSSGSFSSDDDDYDDEYEDDDDGQQFDLEDDDETESDSDNVSLENLLSGMFGNKSDDDSDDKRPASNPRKAPAKRPTASKTKPGTAKKPTAKKPAATKPKSETVKKPPAKKAQTKKTDAESE